MKEETNDTDHLSSVTENPLDEVNSESSDDFGGEKSSAIKKSEDIDPGPIIPDSIGERVVSLRQLIDAGVHFGHQTNRWNPRMAPYIYGARNGIHIIDLDQTLRAFQKAYSFVVQIIAKGGHLLFVGTKRQAQDVILEEATRAGQFHVTGRWLGGTLTNYRTIKISIDRLRNLERMEEEGTLEELSKKEALGLRRDKERLAKYLGGIKEMDGAPSALFVIDPNMEHIAVKEGNKLEIPILALTDTNCNPDPVDIVIPGNDDAIRSIRLIASRLADACLEGRKRRRDYLQGERRSEETSNGVAVEFARTRRTSGNYVYSATPKGESSSADGSAGTDLDE
ncbi:MAG: 30S ribosomal protein S2 [Deltaproteobacteria bacterium]|nr:30S ribosomal protein S2 [Deltaproteobacteria bacterium]